jgi:hypothetical protein
VDGAKAVELVLERLSARAKEVQGTPNAFYKIAEAIEIELDACKATKEAD